MRQKIAQLDALNRGIYVGEDLMAVNTLFQKRRDIDLDAQRMDIDKKTGIRYIGRAETYHGG
jgi:hypothetical protein